ncbi:TRAP transporter large permease [Rhodobacteraceae bacterium RKSG542]|uniref:TRAP transporter large permease n=1 Tax=Pseudovibrio flavus TaxID=2529854 RepID=UPI0012BD6362|nr:TRAP transporter large permease [Pseudovibrio flavus]MTI18958.1 TRAP transporter large permease [Pseudovibrio flavus]
MTDYLGIFILLGSFGALMALRVPIAFALGLSSITTALYLGLPLLMVAQKMVNGLNSFTFLAVPFFILAGQIMTEGGISERLVRFADTLVGRVRGGIAQVNILTSMLFGGISGSSVADVASIGSFLIPGMVKRGYSPSFATAVTVSSSVQGVLIPPSQNMIYYALAAGGLPISKLFLAGYIPGVLIGTTMMAMCFVIALIEKHPRGDRYTFKEALKTTAEASIGLFTIVIIIGGIVLGVFTATESAAVAATYALVISFFVYRTMTAGKLLTVMRSSLETLAMVIAIIMTSSAFGFLLSFLKVPSALSSAIFSLTSDPIGVLLCINLLLLFLGMLMDMGILILILTPILLPVATSIGVDPIHFGMIMLVNLGIGLITPPVGTSLIVGCTIARIPVEKSLKSLLPFYVLMFVILMLITYVPQLSLFLPNLLG